MERNVYIMIMLMFAAIMLPVDGPISAGWFYNGLLYAALFFALTMALRNAKWYWRVSGWLLVVCTMFLNMSESDTIRRHWTLTHRARTNEELRVAANYTERFLAQTKHSYRRYTTGVLWLYLGEEARYQYHRDKLLADFENAYQPEVARK